MRWRTTPYYGYRTDTVVFPVAENWAHSHIIVCAGGMTSGRQFFYRGPSTVRTRVFVITASSPLHVVFVDCRTFNNNVSLPFRCNVQCAFNIVVKLDPAGGGGRQPWARHAGEENGLSRRHPRSRGFGWHALRNIIIFNIRPSIKATVNIILYI